MMSLKKTSLLVLILVATLAFFGCGEEPSDDNNNSTQDGGGTENGTDTTSELFADTSSIESLSTLIDKTYVLDFDAKYWNKPGGDAGEELGGYTPKFAFQIKTIDESLGTFTALFGTAKDGVQDLCNKTYTLTGTLDSTTGATTFVTDALDIDAIIEGPEVSVVATLRGFALSGQFINQGEGYKNGTITAELDGDQIYSLFSQLTPSSADDLCEKLYAVGVSCEACSADTSVVHCLTVEALYLKISETVGLSLVEVAATDQTCL